MIQSGLRSNLAEPELVQESELEPEPEPELEPELELELELELGLRGWTMLRY